MVCCFALVDLTTLPVSREVGTSFPCYGARTVAQRGSSGLVFPVPCGPGSSLIGLIILVSLFVGVVRTPAAQAVLRDGVCPGRGRARAGEWLEKRVELGVEVAAER